MLATDKKSRHQSTKTIFRAYDIRGVYGQNLTLELATDIGKALGTELLERGDSQWNVGRDGRLSSPAIFEALVKGILATGCNVCDVGMVTSPLLYYATHTLPANSGVMITGSHNPANYNGFKMVMQGQSLCSEQIESLHQRIAEQQFAEGEGQLSKTCVLDAYIKEVCHGIKLAKPIKVVIDAGNGVAGKVAPKLLRALGCDVVELFCEVDGHFPNHHPDPSELKNLQELTKAVKQHHASIGLAFDGDGDRLGVITNQGENIWPDRQMMLYAQQVLKNHPGAEIIFDVKCSKHLAEMIEQHHGKAVMWKTGHSLIKTKLKQTNAPLAGEMSGHIFFNDRWYGFDDGVYTAARLLEILSHTEASSAELFARIPNSVNTPELKIPMAEERKASFMAHFIDKANFADGKINTIDGIRVDFAKAWGLLRPSNTTPYLVLRFEADDETALAWVQEQFRQLLLQIDASLTLPF